MKTIVAVVVYNRFQNIKRWITCWKDCNTNAELVIVHNYYGDQKELTKYKNYCEANGIKYVPRNGQGFDIGALQDVCKERLDGFPNDWDYLLWCTDDCFPMSKDFINPFIEKLQDKTIGIAAMQISSSVSPHVRTTGFCIRKNTSLRLKFPADPVTTKQHCYLFEHRGGKLTFTNQIREMGLDCVAVSEIKDSPLWDSDHPNKNKRLDRLQEFNKVWGIKNNDKVVFICPVFNMYPQIISSLICQTHKNWELLLIHNGPLNDHAYNIPDDSRIKFIINPEQTGRWGHPLRKMALNDLDELSDDANYVVITNADNYHVPTFTEYLLNGFKKSHNAVATYCDGMVHSYKAWQVINCRPVLGYIDCAGVMVKKDVACEVGWRDIEGHSSDWTYFEDIIKRYGVNSFQAVKGCLLIHN